MQNYSDTTLSVIKSKASDEKFSKMLIHKPPLIFTSVGITGLLLIHIFSVVRFIQYGDEVLSSKIYHNAISIVHGHGVLSLSAIVMELVSSQIVLYCNYPATSKVNILIIQIYGIVSLRIITLL